MNARISESVMQVALTNATYQIAMSQKNSKDKTSWICLVCNVRGSPSLDSPPVSESIRGALINIGNTHDLRHWVASATSD